MQPYRARPLRAALVVLCLVVTAGAQAPAAMSVDIGEAVDLALARNESVAISATEAAAARQRIREVRADGLPQVTAGFDVTRNWLLPSIVFNDAAVKIGTDNEMTGLLRLGQPLYTGGRVSGELEQARWEAEAQSEEDRQIRQMVTAGVETAVYDYLLAAQLSRVSGLALKRARANEQQVDALWRAGRATAFEQMRARVQVSSAASDSIEAANARALAEIDLKDVIGLDLATPLQVRAEFRGTSRLSLESVDGLIDLALQQRPEPRRLAQLRAAGGGQLQVARAAGRPQLDLVAVGQMYYQADDYGGVSDMDEWRRNWSTGLALRIPLFDGMRSHARTARARQDLKRIDLQIEQLGRQVEGEVRRAWMTVREAEHRLQARKGQVEQASKGLDDAESRYRTGGGTQLEVLDAQLSLQEAESEFARARRDRAVALVELERSTGVLGEGVP